MEILNTKGRRLAILIVFFIVGITVIHTSYSSSLDVNVHQKEKFTEGSYGEYRTFRYNITNEQNSHIKSRLWIIRSERGPIKLYSKNISIEAGESKFINASIGERKDGVTFGDGYQLIIRDIMSGRHFQKRVDPTYNSNKNPEFVDKKGYPFHWTGSIFGQGNYSSKIEGKGLNNSFKNCSSSKICGFRYADDYSLKEVLTIKGSGFNLGKNTSLQLVVYDGEKTIKISVEDNLFDGKSKNETNNFIYETNLEKRYKSENLSFSTGREVKYQLSFESYKTGFHWIDIERFDFYNTG